MAESDQTEEPTEHKLQQARKKGQVCKSQDVTQALLLAGLSAVLYALSTNIYRDIARFAQGVYKGIPHMVLENQLTPYNVNHFGVGFILMFIKIIIPLLAVGFLIALAGNLAQIGFLFATEPLMPKFNKINPMNGLKKIFSIKGAIELVKQIAKVGMLGVIAYMILKKAIPVLANSIEWTLENVTHYIKQIALQLFSQVIVISFVLAGADYLIQKKQFLKDMRMSFKELKDEYKETEGNPEIKSKQKQIARQMAMGGMMKDVQNADAVITNPTELAVAIKYDPQEMPAPVVLAKGKRLIAQQIKEIAEEHDIIIYENVDLAQAMFQACEVGQPIPVELYAAVAEVLAFVYRQKRKKELMRAERLRGGRSPYRKPV